MEMGLTAMAAVAGAEPRGRGAHPRQASDGLGEGAFLTAGEALREQPMTSRVGENGVDVPTAHTATLGPLAVMAGDTGL